MKLMKTLKRLISTAAVRCHKTRKPTTTGDSDAFVTMKVATLLAMSIALSMNSVASFSASPQPNMVHSIKTAFGSFITQSAPADPDAVKREELKVSLLEECRQRAAKPSRERIEALIADLADLSPTPNAACSERLQKQWILEWTTEKEINVFDDWGISGTISQTIDGPDLLNMIPFRRGGSFGVTGRLTIPDPDGIRTDFEFESATLDLGQWGSYQLPPIGKGWFDTIFLDDDLRVDVNSRDDILICTPRQNDAAGEA